MLSRKMAIFCLGFSLNYNLHVFIKSHLSCSATNHLKWLYHKSDSSTLLLKKSPKLKVALSDHTVLVACSFQQSPPNGLVHQLISVIHSSGCLWGYVV